MMLGQGQYRPVDPKKARMRKRLEFFVPLGIILLIVIIIGIFCAVEWKVVKMMNYNVMSPTLELATGPYTMGETYENVQYSEVSENDYVNLYVPYASESEDKAPLFVLVHGGGFVDYDADARSAQFMYRYFRDRGYACASVNYRLADEALCPAAIEDVKASVRFLRANADTYGYNADRIVIWGDGAGGYLAAMAAVTSDDEFSGVQFIGEEDLEEPVSGHIDGLVEFYGITDLTTVIDDYVTMGIPRWMAVIFQLPEKHDYGAMYEELWFGRAASELTQSEIDELNPRYYIEKNWDMVQSLKVMICHGGADLIEPSLQAQRLAEAFDTGVYVRDGSVTGAALTSGNVQYIEYEKYGHGDDRFYEDDALANVKSFISAVYDVS